MCEYLYQYHHKDNCRCVQELCSCQGDISSCSFSEARKTFEADLKEATGAPAKTQHLPSELLAEVCSVILDTGYVGTPEEYVKEFYKKSFAELTVCEAEMIVNTLKSKPGCLHV